MQPYFGVARVINNIGIMLIGRVKEKETLLSALTSDQSEFIAVYGRRRVGKTFLIREAFGYKFSFDHTGILDAPLREQLSEFRESLYRAGMKNKALPKDKMMKALTTVFLIFSVPKPIQGRS